MTAFNDIKSNNWPSADNEFEDFLLLSLPFNDIDSLTESPAVTAGSKVIYPKRTLTNNGVASVESGNRITDNATITGSSWDASHDMKYAFRYGYDKYGDPSTTNSAAFASNGGTYKIVFGDGGYAVSQQIVIKLYQNGGDIKVNHGETDEQTLTSTAGFETWTIPASSVSQLKNIRLSNAGNTGPYLSSVYVDGVHLHNGGAKKFYDNHALWGTGGVSHVSTDALKGVGVKQPWTCEFYWRKDGTQYGNHGHFLLNPNNQTIGYREASATGTSTNDFYCDIGGTTAVGMITTAITEGVWNHFAFVHEGGGTIKTYLNGQLETTKTIGTSGTFADSTSIGGGVGGYTSKGVNGAIQDFRFYATAKYTADFTPPKAILS